MTAPAPFVVKTSQITVEGGFTKEPLVVEYRKVEGDERNWFALGVSFRALARNFGLDMDTPNPYADTNVITFMQNLRNEKVDELLFQQRLENDPMWVQCGQGTEAVERPRKSI